MKLSNQEIADRLNRIGQLYQLQKDRWRSKAFLDASKVIEDLPETIRQTELLEFDSIDKSVSDVIDELWATNTCFRLEELEKQFPDNALDLTWISGVGPVTAQKIAEQWGAGTLEGLLEALEFTSNVGSDLYEKVLAGLERKKQGRLPRKLLEPLAADLVAALTTGKYIIKVELAGSWRRGRLTLKDLDVLIGVDCREALPEIRKIASKFGKIETAGESKIHFRHVNKQFSVNIDFQIADIDCWGAALCYFTGSKAFNERLRSIAKALGMKLNEYGIFRDNIRIGGFTEEEIFTVLGLDYVKPENRRT